ncbi:MAG: hypothetical protein V3U65_11380 [Granulosicoccaceae bacterium]
MKYQIKSTVLLSLLASITLLGCDSSGQLPSDAEVRISPEGQSIDITQITNSNGGCVFNPNNYVDTPLLLSVHDGDGSPIGEAEISVNIDYSGNTFSGPPVLALYEDLNSNGVVDADTELVSGREDNGYVGETRQYSGDKHMFLRINLSCSYIGNIHVRSQFAYKQMNVAVNATRTVTVETTETATATENTAQ